MFVYIFASTRGCINVCLHFASKRGWIYVYINVYIKTRLPNFFKIITKTRLHMEYYLSIFKKKFCSLHRVTFVYLRSQTILVKTNWNFLFFLEKIMNKQYRCSPLPPINKVVVSASFRTQLCWWGKGGVSFLR